MLWVTVSMRIESRDLGSANKLLDHCCLKFSIATTSLCANLRTAPFTHPVPQIQKLETFIPTAATCSSNPRDRIPEILNTASVDDSPITVLSLKLSFRLWCFKGLSKTLTLCFLLSVLPVIPHCSLNQKALTQHLVFSFTSSGLTLQRQVQTQKVRQHLSGKLHSLLHITLQSSYAGAFTWLICSALDSPHHILHHSLAYQSSTHYSRQHSHLAYFIKQSRWHPSHKEPTAALSMSFSSEVIQYPPVSSVYAHWYSSLRMLVPSGSVNPHILGTQCLLQLIYGRSAKILNRLWKS